jgi:hypothetical protein
MDQEEAYRKAASRFQVSYMSDSKWLRLFRAVATSGVTIQRARWTTIDNGGFSERFPAESDLLPTRFRDGRFQPIQYRWILSIFVPRECPPYPGASTKPKQDVAGLRAAIEKVGAFQMEDTGEGLLISAYGR